MNHRTDGKILTVDLAEEMKSSYIDYAMSVIVSRALPDVRDGLKPVHRRILYAMRDMGLTPDKPHRKSARVVGEVLGKYHPHGDVAVYEAMVRLAQDFSTRYPLIDGHGNFGSIDGDPAAAMRYTEVRLSRLSLEMMRDLDKDTVDFNPNFDESMEEPSVLPSRIPNLLANGSSGIAVGMATNIPPHNLGEVIDAVVTLIDDPDVSLQQLMRIVKGPDFPTGALIIGREGIREAYSTGRGIVTMRARAEIETLSRDRTRIVITEIPYQVNKAKLIEQIADLVREKKLDGITDLRDETDRSGLRVVVEVGRTANPNVVLNKLFKNTQLQASFGIIMLALVDGAPRVMTLRQALEHYLEHQKEVIVRRTRHELEKAEARAHILEGLRIALDNIDEVISLIRGSRDVDQAREGLMSRFGLTEVQARAILDMRLQRLTGLEREKITEEYAQLVRDIEYYRAVLASERMVLEVIKQELLEIRERFADPRRTTITAGEVAFEVEDLIAEEDVAITLTHRGYIKRLPLTTYKSQHRGGRGVAGVTTRKEDFVEELYVSTTHHHLLFLTNRGKVYRLKVHELPEAGRQARGTAIINLIQLSPGEQVTEVIPIRDFSAGFLTLATRTGMVKKTRLAEFDNIPRSGLIAVELVPEDELIGVELTDGKAELMLITKRGMAIRFDEEDVRSMGRAARGVHGIKLEPGDEVVAMAKVLPDADLLLVTEKGYGKRTPLAEYRPQARAGKGLKTLSTMERVGALVAAKVVFPEDEVMLASAGGIVIRLKAGGISRQGRYTQGVTLMKVEEGDRVVAVARVAARQDVTGSGVI